MKFSRLRAGAKLQWLSVECNIRLRDVILELPHLAGVAFLSSCS
jgi:hypothetical protein